MKKKMTLKKTQESRNQILPNKLRGNYLFPVTLLEKWTMLNKWETRKLISNKLLQKCLLSALLNLVLALLVLNTMMVKSIVNKWI